MCLGFSNTVGSITNLNIDTAGQVGIGTANPYGQLDIFSSKNTKTDVDDAGNYHLHLHNPDDDTNESVGIGFGLTSDHDAVGAAIAHERKGSNSYGDLYFSTRPNGGSVTERLRILSDGNVGIGTDNPYGFETTATRLHVKNAGSAGSVSEVGRFEGASDADGAGALVRIGTSNDRGMYLEGGRVGSVPYASIGTTEYEGSKTEGIRIDNAGNVGIGVADPDTLLEVAGVIKSSSTSRVQADVLNNSANSANIIYRSSTSTIVGNNASALVVLDGGNVGIGVTDPDQKLEVNGNIRIPNQGKIVFGSAGSASDYLELYDVGAGNPLLKLSSGWLKH